MEPIPQVQLSEFQEALTPQRMMSFRVVAGALLAGATLFLGIILFLYFGSSADSNAVNVKTDDSILPILTVVHIIEVSICYLSAFFVYRFFASPKGFDFLQKKAKMRAGMQADLPIQQRIVGAIFTSFIISAALLEGVAMFGMIICMVGVTDGQIQQQPVYWLNLFSYVVFSIFILKTFPTKARLENIFQDRFQTDRII